MASAHCRGGGGTGRALLRHGARTPGGPGDGGGSRPRSGTGRELATARRDAVRPPTLLPAPRATRAAEPDARRVGAVARRGWGSGELRGGARVPDGPAVPTDHVRASALACRSARALADGAQRPGAQSRVDRRPRL